MVNSIGSDYLRRLEDRMEATEQELSDYKNKCQRYEEALKILAYGKSLGSWEMMRELAQQALKGGGSE